MRNRILNKKGFTLVELLAVIVVLAIIMMIAVTSVTGILEKSRKNAFFTTASSFIDAVRNDAIINSTLPACGSSKEVKLSTSLLEKGGKESPYGNNYRYYENSTCDDYYSFVLVNSTVNDNSCDYSYEIFLYDGEHVIGSITTAGENVNISGEDAINLSSDSVDVVALPAGASTCSD